MRTPSPHDDLLDENAYLRAALQEIVTHGHTLRVINGVTCVFNPVTLAADALRGEWVND